MIRKLILLMAAALLAAGCGGGLSPDSEVEGEIGSDAAEIGDEWDDAEEELLAAGRPVEDDWPCMTWKLSGDGAVLVEVESDDFDPVLAVYGEDGEVLALCDDWDGDLEESLVALASVPGGATLMLFAADGDDGEFELECTVASDEDLEEFALACDLADGVLEGYKSDEKDDDLLEEVLEDVLEDHVYDKDFANASVHGFGLDADGPVKVTVESDDFDTYLVLLGVDGDDLRFIDYDDDGGNNTNSALMSELEAGDYLAVVLSYTDAESGDYLLEVETLEEELLEPDPVPAEEPGVSYSVEVTGQTPIAYAYTGGGEFYVPGLNPFSPVAAFEFTVEETGIYQLDGFSEMDDVVLSLWDAGTEAPVLMEYDDDGSGTGTDSRMVVMLPAGEYVALVSSYSGGLPDGELGFSWQPAQEEMRSLRPGRAVEAAFTYETTDVYYTFEVDGPGELVVTADAVTADIDPYIDLWSPEGAGYSNDDGGEDFNSRLEVQVGPEDTGEWTLHVTTYGGGEGRIRVRAEHTPGASRAETGEMPEPEEPPADEPPAAPTPGSARI
ncbi:MAG: hypothetical protein R6U36_12190 [Candidatus Fermentibacteraceae bacterium]